MKLVIISGLSGSGKTVALRTLEDEDYYCVDNLPLGLLPDFIDRILNRDIQSYENIAVGIDARSDSDDLKKFNETIEHLRKKNLELEVIYLQAELSTLIKRFSDTRRKHPLTTKGLPLSEAIEAERNLLSDIATESDLLIDTTFKNIHQLRDIIKERVIKNSEAGLSLLFQSFGFKHGSPTDSDFVFDVRCLPNPYWEVSLRSKTGLDTDVINFLQSKSEVKDMMNFIIDFLQNWVPKFEKQNRYYLTISIGCTGGQHRSVFIAQELYDWYQNQPQNASIRHREIQ